MVVSASKKTVQEVLSRKIGTVQPPLVLNNSNVSQTLS